MKKIQHTRGTDPEFFMVDKVTGKLVSAIPYVDGVKYEPKKLKCGGTVIRDNVALEFATPPTGNEDDFVESVRTCIREVRKLIPKKFDIQALPSGNFDEDQLDNDEAKQFGCEPDYDAWKLKMNKPPDSEELTLRTCGGHIHIGRVEGDGNDFLHDPYGRADTIKVMDAVHGIISAILDNSSAALKRKELYGKAGCHRPTEYGVEYRTLSNYWLKSPQLVRLMDNLTSDVLRIMRLGKNKELIGTIGDDQIQNVINTNDVESAREILNTHLRPHLSNKSLELIEECEANIEFYEFDKEWGIM